MVERCVANAEVAGSIPVARSTVLWEGEFPWLNGTGLPVFVYLLMQGDEVVYVGQTGGLRTRLLVHARWMPFDRVRVQVFPNRKAAMDAEETLIWQLDPKFNARGRQMGFEAGSEAAWAAAKEVLPK